MPGPESGLDDSQLAEHLLRVRQEIFRQLVMFCLLKRSQTGTVFVYVVDVSSRISHQYRRMSGNDKLASLVCQLFYPYEQRKLALGGKGQLPARREYKACSALHS